MNKPYFTFSRFQPIRRLFPSPEEIPEIARLINAQWRSVDEPRVDTIFSDVAEDPDCLLIMNCDGSEMVNAHYVKIQAESIKKQLDSVREKMSEVLRGMEKIPEVTDLKYAFVVVTQSNDLNIVEAAVYESNNGEGIMTFGPEEYDLASPTVFLSPLATSSILQQTGYRIKTPDLSGNHYELLKKPISPQEVKGQFYVEAFIPFVSIRGKIGKIGSMFLVHDGIRLAFVPVEMHRWEVPRIIKPPMFGNPLRDFLIKCKVRRKSDIETQLVIGNVEKNPGPRTERVFMLQGEGFSQLALVEVCDMDDDVTKLAMTVTRDMFKIDVPVVGPQQKLLVRYTIIVDSITVDDMGVIVVVGDKERRYRSVGKTPMRFDFASVGETMIGVSTQSECQIKICARSSFKVNDTGVPTKRKPVQKNKPKKKNSVSQPAGKLTQVLKQVVKGKGLSSVQAIPIPVAGGNIMGGQTGKKNRRTRQRVKKNVVPSKVIEHPGQVRGRERYKKPRVNVTDLPLEELVGKGVSRRVMAAPRVNVNELIATNEDLIRRREASLERQRLKSDIDKQRGDLDRVLFQKAVLLSSDAEKREFLGEKYETFRMMFG